MPTINVTGDPTGGKGGPTAADWKEAVQENRLDTKRKQFDKKQEQNYFKYQRAWDRAQKEEENRLNKKYASSHSEAIQENRLHSKRLAFNKKREQTAYKYLRAWDKAEKEDESRLKKQYTNTHNEAIQENRLHAKRETFLSRQQKAAVKKQRDWDRAVLEDEKRTQAQAYRMNAEFKKRENYQKQQTSLKDKADAAQKRAILEQAHFINDQITATRQKRQSYLQGLAGRGALGRVAAWGQSGGPNGTSGGGMRGGIGSLAGWALAAEAGPLGLGAKALMEAGTAYAMAPQTMAKFYGGLWGGSQKWVGLRQGSTAFGRAGGYDGSGLLNEVMGDGGGPPAWRTLRGLTGEEAYGLRQAYGISGMGAGDDRENIKRISDASIAPYNGLSKTSLAGMLNTHTTLSGSGTETQYFRELQRTMTVAVRYGMDQTQVAATLDGLARGSAGAGAAYNNESGNMDFWKRMTSTGSASMRSGEGVVSFANQIKQASYGAGWDGNDAQRFMFHKFVADKGGMKNFRSMASLSKVMGHAPRNPAERIQYQAMIDAAGSGSESALGTAFQPFLQDNQFFTDYAKKYGFGTRGIGQQLTARANGVDPNALNLAYAGNGSRPPLSKAGWDKLDDDQKSAIAASLSSGYAPHASPQIIAALAMQESGWRLNPNPGAAHRGLGQVDRGSFLDAQKAGFIDPSISFDSTTDNYKNGVAALAGVYELKYKNSGGDERKALKNYYGNINHGPGQPTPDEYADNVVGNKGVWGNPDFDINSAKAKVDTTQTLASQQMFSALNASNTSGLLDQSIKFSEGVVHNTDALLGLTTTIEKLIKAISAPGATRPSHGASTLKGQIGSDLLHLFH